ncbi:hypothetical protein Tsubulata_028191 [Turnera subulata]|uniref:Aluminum-activated malate transporter n=1 Tax=Turnera subulata TaxID=218843 RepID=A0A9Q0FKV6_9ROSI|nr:hypothetical protein Tsubulata_028191 [Turnera subulata]
MLVLKSLRNNTRNRVVDTAKKAKKLAKDDPRRVIHSFKPLYEGFGDAAMWAVLTVVVVMEFSVGFGDEFFQRSADDEQANTADKSFLQGYKTILTSKSNEETMANVAGWEPFHGRFKFRHPWKQYLKVGTTTRQCAYKIEALSCYIGSNIQLWHMAHKRLSTICIGCVGALIICVFICPVWIGEDLHSSIASNIDKLGNFLVGFGDEFFQRSADDEQANTIDKSFLQGYKTILTSKSNEETMVNLARWEPFHGRFKFRHPWKQYLKVGATARQCAYKIEALSCYIGSNIQIPVEIRSKLEEKCTKISSETGKALKELATSVKTMTVRPTAESHIANSKEAAETLKTILNTGHCIDGAPLLEIIPTVTVASLLIDVVACTEDIAKSVETLARMARFMGAENTILAQQEEHPHLLHRGTVQPVSDGTNHVVVDIDRPSRGKPDIEDYSSAPVVG